MKREVYVYHETADQIGYEEAVEILDHLGYPVNHYTTHIPDGECYVIDHRYPVWRGWKEAIRDIIVFHPNEMVEYRKYKVDIKACSLYDSDDTCPT